MASSTLDPDNIPATDRQLGKGHGADSLGPSDISDTGSDEQGGLRAVEEQALGLDQGTNEDATSRNIAPSHETDDSGRTGEATSAGRQDEKLGKDISVDRIEALPLEGDPHEDDARLDTTPPARQDDTPRALRH